MAPDSNGRSGNLGQAGPANGLGDGAPPPSTLAAQLVENIAASSRSSRPDETTELKKLFVEIERIKDNPEQLKTQEERVEHNHMLIYVYARVVLEGLKWDDPFADKNKLQTEALKAIEFLKVTIKETPTVLQYCPDAGTFLFRGHEPLWLWVLPKILRMLGHSKCSAISKNVEQVCQFILLLSGQNGCLWDLGLSIVNYLQSGVSAILEYLRGPIDSIRSQSTDLSLPPRIFFEAALNYPPDAIPPGCSYTIRGPDHAVAHACGILSALRSSISGKHGSEVATPYSEYSLWVLEAVVSLHTAQVGIRNSASYDIGSLIQVILDLSDSQLESKLSTALVILCHGALEDLQRTTKDEESSSKLRRVVCSAIVQIVKDALQNRSIAKLALSQLVTPFQAIPAESTAFRPETDIWRCFQLLLQATSHPAPEKFSAEVMPESFQDPDLRLQVESLRIKAETDDRQDPQIKRRKLSSDVECIPIIVSQMTRLVHLDSNIDPLALGSHLPEMYPTMGEIEQCQLLDLLASLACAVDDTLRISGKTPKSSPRFTCTFCVSYLAGTPQPRCLHPGMKGTILEAFSRIVRLPFFFESKRPRIVAMIALRRLVRHFPDQALWNLEASALGQWCIQCLQSHTRELRISATRALAEFLRQPPNEGVTEYTIARNRANVFDFVKSLAEKDVPYLNETCVMIWGQVGKIASDEEVLGLALHKLTEYFGHRNMIISALALNEILNVAETRGTLPRKLFEPFWKNIAFSVVKDMVTRPQTTRTVADLLQMKVSDLLCLLQRYALPYLVLTKRREVIQKIAEARGEEDSAELIQDIANIPHILALLLTQDMPDIESFAMTSLRQISSYFNHIGLLDLFRNETRGNETHFLTVLELLKISAEADDARKARARKALTWVATLLLAQHKPKKGQAIGQYFQMHALGLTIRLSETINESMGLHPPVQEQRLAIAAMEEMIRLCKSYVRIARPQISACLLSAITFDELRSATISCWAAMLINMEREDVEAQIETTFFIITQYWTTLKAESREKVKSLLSTLMTSFREVMQDYGKKLPSLRHIGDLSDFHEELEALRRVDDAREAFDLFAQRLYHENLGVVLQSLGELTEYLHQHQSYLQTSVISQQPDTVVTKLMRALLDCSSKYNGLQNDISRLCAESIGLIGCLDSNRLETSREEEQFIAVHNFADPTETTDFVVFLLENVLVKAFLSTTDTKLQGFLSYVMQELLDRCDFRAACNDPTSTEKATLIYQKWLKMSKTAQEVLSPFLTSIYVIAPMPTAPAEYPIFRPGKPYGNWIKSFVLDLLKNPQNLFAEIIFDALCRVIRVKDLSVTEFLLPYVTLHVVVGQGNGGAFGPNISKELLEILQYEPGENASYNEREEARVYHEAVFRILDYFMRWAQLKREKGASRQEQQEFELQLVEDVIRSLPPELLSKRAVDCKQYARALFFLEPHLLKDGKLKMGEEVSEAYQALQDIYTEIDDPDALEGLFVIMPQSDLAQQTQGHRKAGRWTAAQTWYEIQLAESPGSLNVQLDLLTCLKESGQHDVLLNYVEGMKHNASTVNKLVPFAVEASWATGRWQTMEKYLRLYNADDSTEVFNLGIAQALLCLKNKDLKGFREYIHVAREKVASSLTYTATSSLHAAHDAMLKCHVLSDLEIISDDDIEGDGVRQSILASLERRLEVLGANMGDKQYILAIRRAAMELLRFADEDISSLWLYSARLARKSSSMHQSFNAVLHAQKLNDPFAQIENAKLLWKDGHSRKAIQILERAMDDDVFQNISISAAPTSSKASSSQANLLMARAHLLHAKWLDSTGQTHASALRLQYQQAAKTHAQWEKGHYYLGRHYKKVLESEKTLKPDQQSDEYLTGDTAKLVIENYMRSLNFGTKYLYQTLPRILTLWLDLASQVDKPPEGKAQISRELLTHRQAVLLNLHHYMRKHIPRMPAYIFYTALPQIVARIVHPHPEVYSLLEAIIVKVVESYPRQALWSVLSCMPVSRQPLDRQPDRRARGAQVWNAIKNAGKKVEVGKYDLRQVVRMSEKLAEQLLLACINGEFQNNRTVLASISRDLRFNHKCTPCALVVPFESCLAATLPTLTDNMRRHKPFSRDVITIESFLDEVLVLGSLAKPRKLTAIGSDGKRYGLLVKPKDDLRTDQRLMEFNGIINRALKRDAESSRRQLYIRTYAVTPLNEECGIIEWVDGLKTLRDILLGIYKTRGISPNYTQIAELMKAASSSEKQIHLFTRDVLGVFPPVLPEWFTSQFPNPSTWFAARVKYTRSCAVMSMVGTILGLGDRHGENILLEEGNGGVFHVDFNCLFDKGLTFAQPERVPFRLTHNMQAAMGPYHHEGPFRQCSELTLRILRQQEETLMTILEAFIYDPTLDLQKDKKRKNEVVRLHPTSVVESIKRKVRGMLPGESIPLGVEGQVEELIKQATDPRNLTAMYIGWCPFL